MSLRVYFPNTAKMLRDLACAIRREVDSTEGSAEIRWKKVELAVKRLNKALWVFYDSMNQLKKFHSLDFLDRHVLLLAEAVLFLVTGLKAYTTFDTQFWTVIKTGQRRFMEELWVRRVHPDGEHLKRQK